MKRMFLFPVLVFSFFHVQSQDFKKVETAVILKQPETAKAELDKVMSDPKAQQKPEGLYYRAWIYSSFYKDPVLRAKYPNSEVTADEALKKYAQSDTAFAQVKQYGAEPFFNIYSISFNEGIRTFNEKKWDSASHFFGLAAEYSEYIFKNKWSASTSTFDTTTVEYAGFANQNNNKPDEAMRFYEQIANHRIGGKEFMDIYRFMLDYYSKAKSNDKFKATLAETKELYPDQAAMWNQFEMQNLAQNANMDDILAKYKQEDAGGKLTEDQYVNYAETFAGLNKAQLDKLDSLKQIDLKNNAADAYKKAFAINNTNGLYAFNTGVLYYSIFAQLDDRFYNLKGESASLKSQRDAVTKQQQEIAATAIEWLEKGYTILKAKTTRDKNESNSLNRAVDYLANLFLWKRDKTKGVDPKNYDVYDAKYKQYDAEHNKYKI